MNRLMIDIPMLYYKCTGEKISTQNIHNKWLLWKGSTCIDVSTFSEEKIIHLLCQISNNNECLKRHFNIKDFTPIKIVKYKPQTLFDKE